MKTTKDAYKKALSIKTKEIKDKIRKAVEEEDMVWLQQTEKDNKEWQKRIDRLEHQLQTQKDEIFKEIK